MDCAAFAAVIGVCAIDLPLSWAAGRSPDLAIAFWWQHGTAASESALFAGVLSDVDPDAVIRGIWLHIVTWVANGYRQAPLVMVGLSAIVAAPVLALAGLVLRRAHPRRERLAPIAEEPPPVPQNAWIAVEDEPATARTPVSAMLRIGRQEDNDLCLSHKTVHRYHAVVYRSDEAQYMIMNLSGADGNGIKVNGQLVEKSPLTGGDRVELGAVRLRFEAACS